MVGEWALPEEMIENLPPSNNCILGHVVYRLTEKSLPSQVESKESELPSCAIKGCILGKTFSGKTTALKALEKGKISFFLYLYLSNYLTLTVTANGYVCRKYT